MPRTREPRPAVAGAIRGCVTTLPVVDLARARSFYVGVLGLAPLREAADELVLDAGGGTRLLLAARGETPKGIHTAFSLEAARLDDMVQHLRAAGVTFEDYELPGLRTVDGVWDGGYVRTAWFKDPEGNLVALHEPRDPRLRVGT